MMENKGELELALDRDDFSVDEAWDLFCQAAIPWNFSLKQGEKPSPEVIRTVFATATLVLRTYALPNNWPDLDGPPNENIPHGFAIFLADQFAYLADGVLPEPIRDARINHRAPRGIHELRDIGIAVAYIKAARDGLISDRHPIPTIADAYSVPQRTVKYWQKEQKLVTPSDFYPDRKGQELGRLLTRRMKSAAKRHRQQGRSDTAVINRAKKT